MDFFSEYMEDDLSYEGFQKFSMFLSESFILSTSKIEGSRHINNMDVEI